MLAGAHKKFYRIQHPEIYLLDLKVRYKHKIKLPLDMVSKHVFLYFCLSDYLFRVRFKVDAVPTSLKKIPEHLREVTGPVQKNQASTPNPKPKLYD